MADSERYPTHSPNTLKPTKPRQDSPPKPAWPHRNIVVMTPRGSQWTKRRREGGKPKDYCFGPIDNPDLALARWLAVRDDWEAGRPVYPTGSLEPARVIGITVAEGLNRYLTWSLSELELGHCAQSTHLERVTTCGLIADALGRERVVDALTPEDFRRIQHTASGYQPIQRRKIIGLTKTAFNWLWDEGLLTQPLRFGRGFVGATDRQKRLREAEWGDRTVEAPDIQKLLEFASPEMRAHLLLGINAGFGQTDCSIFKLSDLKGRWISGVRQKTGARRLALLWPETVEAIHATAKKGPRAWSKPSGPPLLEERMGTSGKRVRLDLISDRMRKLTKRTGVSASYYDLRRTFKTIGSEAADSELATEVIMGHTVDVMYLQRFDVHRIAAVSQHVRSWLVAGGPGPVAGEWDPGDLSDAPQQRRPATRRRKA